MKILNECKTTEKASDDDVSQFAAQKLPNGPNAKCFMACFYEKVGVVRLLDLIYGFHWKHIVNFCICFCLDSKRNDPTGWTEIDAGQNCQQ